jgi:phospholipase/lecithinase/hemolysin
MHPRTRFTLSTACLALLFAPAIHAAPISGLYIFGDSLSDPGNNAIAFGSTASPPFNVTQRSEITSNSFVPTYPYASSYQYSNGNVWAYQFATMLGLSSQVAGPVLGGGIGTNYAFGGAATGPLNNSSPPPSLLTQTANFIASLGAAQAPGDALYVVAGGGNNARAAMTAIVGGADPTSTITATAVQFAADIGNIVDALQGKGAQNIVVWNAPNLGLAPALAAGGPAAVALSTTLSQSMNDALALRLGGETGVKTFDFFGLITAVNANPGAYGLTNTTDASGAIPGADLSTYLCWDGIHPTSAGHAILAQSMYVVAVPEPSGYLLVATSLLPIVTVLRRRSKVVPVVGS